MLSFQYFHTNKVFMRIKLLIYYFEFNFRSFICFEI